MHTYIHIYIYMYIHTYIHSYIHTGGIHGHRQRGVEYFIFSLSLSLSLSLCVCVCIAGRLHGRRQGGVSDGVLQPDCFDSGVTVYEGRPHLFWLVC